MNRVILDDKDPSETYSIQFDFGQRIASISSVTVVCSTLVDCTTPGPDTTNIAVTSPTFFRGIVTQVLSGGINGNTYKLVCTATGAEGTFVLTCEQPVRSF